LLFCGGLNDSVNFLMPKVSEFVADTVWAAGSAWKGADPELSIFLPTFRRGRDGLLQAAIDSVRGQTFRDFELIVIDDASTDGSADIIRRAMADDGRIGCLTHPRNIGLPAVSEFEAYLKSRGRFIGFAFDDFIFDPGAFEQLLPAARAHPQSLVHGYADMVGSDGHVNTLGKAEIPYGNLAKYNFIANASVVVPKTIVEQVGFFDPHVLAARECDWDLWRRVHRHYPIIRVPAFMGREMGPSLADSLGRVYPVYKDVRDEFNSSRSPGDLLPENLPDRDVTAVPEASSHWLRAATAAACNFFEDKAWISPARGGRTVDRDILATATRPIVGVLGHMDASVSLCFDGIKEQYGSSLRFIDLSAPYARQLQAAMTCDAIIIVRFLFDDSIQALTEACLMARIDLYYLADDNFIELAREDRSFARYKIENMRRALRRFKAVLATSPSLADYYTAENLHGDVRPFGPVFDRIAFEKYRRIPQELHSSSLRIGFIGGDFRRADLECNIYPALEAVAKQGAVELFARKSPKPKAWTRPRPPVTFRDVPPIYLYDDFAERWRRPGIDILVHPKGASSNIAYKTDSVLLTSLYLGAVPLVTDEMAFAGAGENEGIIKVNGASSEWAAAIERVRDANVRAELVKRLEAYCRSHFNSAYNAGVFETILASAKPAGIGDRLERFSMIIENTATRLVEAEAQLGSRAFRLAVRLRKLANIARHGTRWLRRG
jgi:glycosyltransferase involved in cell wall biosynthesis